MTSCSDLADVVPRLIARTPALGIERTPSMISPTIGSSAAVAIPRTAERDVPARPGASAHRCPRRTVRPVRDDVTVRGIGTSIALINCHA